jgi:subtilisin family serine protease
MKQQYVILRGLAGQARDIFLGANTAAIDRTVAALEVSVDKLSRRDLLTVSRDPSIIGIAPVMPMKLIAPVLVSDALEGVPGTVEWGIQAVQAHTSSFDGSGIVVAVLDTGIDKTHTAFAGATIVEKDFTGAGNGDIHGHGTHCAGTIFGRDVGGMRIGVARGVEKALIGKVLGPQGGSSDKIAEAILWAVDGGANVISMSLGIDFPGAVKQWEQTMPTEMAVSRALEGYRANVQLFERLAALVRAQSIFGKTAIIVAAAGNESQRGVNPDFEIAVAPPAVSEGLVSVAALGQSAGGYAVAPFSNTGANIAGPGVDIVSAKKGGGLQGMSGTSMATPHVAGIAALWAQKIKATGFLTEKILTARLISSGTLTSMASGFDPFDVGAGMVCAPQN